MSAPAERGSSLGLTVGMNRRLPEEEVAPPVSGRIFHHANSAVPS